MEVPEKLAMVLDDNQVGKDQWPNLVEYWQREDVKEQAKKNSEARKKLPYNHRKGRTSCANVRERKKINEELEKVPDEERTTEYREKIFVDIFGNEKYGRVRTMGPGVTPTDIYGPRPRTRSRGSILQMVGRIEEMEKRDEERNREFERKQKELEKREEERNATYERKQKEMDNMMAFWQRTMDAFSVEVPENIETPRSSFGQVGTCNSGHLDDINDESEHEDGFQND